MFWETHLAQACRWPTQALQRRCSHLALRLFVVCIGTFCILFAVVQSGGSAVHWSFLTAPARVSELSELLNVSDTNLGSDGDGDGRGDGGLFVSTSRLVEPSLPTHAWFSDDRRCAHLVTSFGRPGSLPDARLASYFRSGNTWTRYLLEAATGFVTCGPVHDAEDNEPLPVAGLPSVAEVANSRRSSTSAAELRNAGFIAEHVSSLTRTCIVGKTHAYPPTWRRTEGADPADIAQMIREDFGNASNPNAALARNSSGYLLPAILLVRDPFRAVISLRHFSAQHSVFLRESRAGIAAFQGPDWRRFVETHSRYWAELAAVWADGPRHTLLVSYERLQTSPAVQLRRMLRFLGVVASPARLRCTLRHVDGPFHNERHPVVPDETVFDADTRRLVWSRIHLLDDLLASRGYRRLPLHKYAFYGTV